MSAARWLMLAIVVSTAGERPAAPVPAQAVFLRQARVLGAALDQLDTLVATSPGDSVRLRMAFRTARAAYKSAEWWLATDSMAVAALDAPVNDAGNDVDDRDDSADAIAHGIPLPTPVGLQAVEALLFPAVARDIRWPLHDALGPARAMLRANPDLGQWTDVAVFDAARAELARIESAGMADVDSPLVHDGIRESAAALDGLADALAVYPTTAAVDSMLRRGAAMMRAASNADRFDRFAFLTTIALPAGRALAIARDAARVPLTTGRSLWRPDAATLVDSGAFDPWAFAPADAPPPNDNEVALGRSLFADPTLGGTSGRACASCHQPARAFTDGLRHTRGRVTPTLIGAALEPALFVDLRVATLEDQVSEVVANRQEMAGVPLDTIAHRLATRPGMVRQFAAAFLVPARPDAVTAARMRWALAAYERTLVRFDSPFDRALRGDSTNLSADARHGFTTFMGRARCGSCHRFPLFTDAREVEVLGTPSTADRAHAVVDADVGRYRITHDVRDRYGFRVPTVRNAGETGPYMHNGVYRSLDDVVTFYDRGGGAGIGVRLPNQTLPSTPLHLTTIERRELLAFLRSLTD